MIDFVQLQNDVFMALLSAQSLTSVNVKQFRKMVIESEIDMKLVYLTQRNSRLGAGVLVEMPTLNCDKPNVTGPILEVGLSILVMEQPTINMSAAQGTLLSAEEIAKRVLETCHLLHTGNALLRAASAAVTPANEYAGVIAYRVNLSTMSASEQPVRPAMVSIDATDLSAVTLACADTTALIYYTLDGSYPAKYGNPKSLLYESPLGLQTGDVIRAASYAEGKNVGSVKIQTI